MNEGLFEKYSRVLVQKNVEKKEVLELLKKITGIDFKENEIIIDNKKISFHTTSVKKSIINQKSINKQLQEKGYNVK